MLQVCATRVLNTNSQMTIIIKMLKKEIEEQER